LIVTRRFPGRLTFRPDAERRSTNPDRTPSGRTDRGIRPATHQGTLEPTAVSPVPPGAAAASRGVRIDGPVPRSDLDSTIAEIWADELGVETLGIHDTFATLGGVPETADRLRARLCESIQVRLPADAVHASQTVAKLADQIAVIRYKGSQDPTLVKIKEGGGPPLFCIAGGGGYAFNFLSLAQALDPRQPVYALHAHGLESRARADWTVAGHARRHLATIRRIQPTGPYLLLGFSFGGLVAYDIAQRLLADGADVAQLAIIDTPLPSLELARRGPRRRGAFRQVGVAVRTVTGTVSGPLGLVKSCFLPLVGLIRFPGRHNVDLFWLWSAIMVNLYEIAPYRGKATVYLAGTGSNTTGNRWAELLVNDGRRVLVPGDHDGMMRKPQVAKIAADIGPHLRAAVGRSDHHHATATINDEEADGTAPGTVDVGPAR
jgi:thioesterase domain-containing protein